MDALTPKKYASTARRFFWGYRMTSARMPKLMIYASGKQLLDAKRGCLWLRQTYSAV